MSDLDPHDRINLTGPWAGFGFQGGHMFTPEGHQLEPNDMVWWSLTCNIAREWRLMMEQARPAPSIECSADARNSRAGAGHRSTNVIVLHEAIQALRQRRLGVDDRGPDAGASNVVYMRRGPRPDLRG